MNRDELDHRLALDVLSAPGVRDALTDGERRVVDAWLKAHNDRRGTPPWPNTRGSQ